MRTRRLLILILVLLGMSLAACSPPASIAPTNTPRTDGLSDQQAATLGSLQKLDDYPLYTMRLVGAYDSRSFIENNRLANAQPEISNAWACSLFAALGDTNNQFYGRNFDWEYSPALLLFTEPSDGYASVSMVDLAYLGFKTNATALTDLSLVERRALLRAPFLPFDGMNARGLVVAMAAVDDGQMKPDPSKETIDSLMVIRKILDSAANVDEAVAILRRYNISMSGGPPLHYLMADQSGRAALVEFYQGKLIVIPNETQWHQATNFIRSSVDNPAGQCSRYDKIAERLGQTGGRVTAQNAMQLLREVSQRITQWSIVYGMTSGEITVTMGRQYDRVHPLRLKLVGK